VHFSIWCVSSFVMVDWAEPLVFTPAASLSLALAPRPEKAARSELPHCARASPRRRRTHATQHSGKVGKRNGLVARFLATMSLTAS
jgi:hypothetical protein